MTKTGPHQKTQYEFIAKKVNDLLKKQVKNKELGFMTFIFDVGEGGYMGYLASTRRIDALAMILEWLTKMIQGMTDEDKIELIEKIRAEAKK